MFRSGVLSGPDIIVFPQTVFCRVDFLYGPSLGHLTCTHVNRKGSLSVAYRKQCVDQVSGGFRLEDTRFPWNNRGGLLYGGIIAGITAYLMALFNMSRSIGDFRPEYIIQITNRAPLIVQISWELARGNLTSFSSCWGRLMTAIW